MGEQLTTSTRRKLIVAFVVALLVNVIFEAFKSSSDTSTLNNNGEPGHLSGGAPPKEQPKTIHGGSGTPSERPSMEVPSTPPPLQKEPQQPPSGTSRGSDKKESRDSTGDTNGTPHNDTTSHPPEAALKPSSTKVPNADNTVQEHVSVPHDAKSLSKHQQDTSQIPQTNIPSPEPHEDVEQHDKGNGNRQPPKPENQTAERSSEVPPQQEGQAVPISIEGPPSPVAPSAEDPETETENEGNSILGQERRVQELLIFKLRERARKIAAQRHKKLASDPELAQNATALKLLHSPPLDKVVGFRQMASSFLNKSFAATARQNLFVYDTVWPTFPEVLSSSVVTDQKSHTLYGGAEGSQSVPNTKEATLASRGKSGQKAPKTPPTFTSDGIQEDVTEGHCNMNSDNTNNVFSREFSGTEARVLRLMDKFDALDQTIRGRVESQDIPASIPTKDDPFVRKALAQQRKISRLVEAELRAELRDGEKVAEDHAAAGTNANPTKAGEHPTIRWMRKSRWLLDVFVPFMDEQSCVPVSAEDPAPSSYQFRAKKSNKADEWAFYTFNNVCINSETGGLSGVFPPAWEAMHHYGMDDLSEERNRRVRSQLFIWNRAKMNRTNPIPKCFVDVPILLHPILFQSDNLGHVLYRLLAVRTLLTEFAKLQNHGFEKMVLGFLVAHSSQKTFGLNNKYRMWYQMLGHRWFSVKASGNIREGIDSLPKGSEENEICFKQAFLGWATVPMYQNSVKYIDALKLSRPAVQRIRHQIKSCYNLPPRVFHRGSGVVSEDEHGKLMLAGDTSITDRPQVTIVTRKNRRILNQAEFAHRIAARYPDADVVVADFEGMTLQQQVNITHNTDVLIGIHGTALQYVLNQPTNGVMVELQYDTGKYYCTQTGINSPNRVYCEFGRTSVISEVTQIVHRVPRSNNTGCNMKTFNDCDITLTVEAQNEIIDSAMCSLQAGFTHATRECSLKRRWADRTLRSRLKKEVV